MLPLRLSPLYLRPVAAAPQRRTSHAHSLGVLVPVPRWPTYYQLQW